MKKIIMTLLFLFTVFSLSNISNSNAESNVNSTVNEYNYRILEDKVTELENKVAELERKIYISDLIQKIEMESEVIIPNHFDDKYVEFIYVNADSLDISIRTAFRLVFKECSFVDTLTSSAGAYGLMQLMPDTKLTYQQLLRTDTLNLDNNEEDIYIGLNYLKDLYEYWLSRGNKESTSWRLALASYNAGKGNVLKYHGIPPYKETQDFVAFIAKLHSNPTFLTTYNKKYENAHKGNS